MSGINNPFSGIGKQIQSALADAAASPLRFASGGPVPAVSASPSMSMRDYGMVRIQGQREYPIMGKKDVIEAVMEEINRGTLVRSN